MILYGVVVSPTPGNRYLMENHPPVKVATLKMPGHQAEVGRMGEKREALQGVAGAGKEGGRGAGKGGKDVR